MNYSQMSRAELQATLEKLQAEYEAAKAKKLSEMRDKLISLVNEKIPYVRLNGHPEKRLAGNVNMCFST